MGMDLEPINPSAEAPRYPDDDKHSPGEIICGRYNWSGWSWLTCKLKAWGMDTSEFRGMNDGDVISDKTCKAVADALEAHLPELQKEYEAEELTALEEWDQFVARTEWDKEMKAKALKEMGPQKVADYMNWIRESIVLWRTCGGYRQY